ncbi:L,D-transpeptidase [Caulobacter sp. S45]|uniref:L,D-transpeptidase family protein n=1 Tax=Caulobacter sp. S45 TaxID=1641861 RepID=UPI001576020E|nr:L,D-transpeptidase [Caulobacter sp. S45]
MTLSRMLLASAAVLTLAACSQSPTSGGAGKTASTNTTDDASTKAAASGPSGLSLQAINGAQFTAPAGAAAASGNETGGDNEINGYDNVAGNATGSADPDTKSPSPTLVRAEVLLDRAAFSPGVIDGRMGENVKHAIMAYDQAHGLQPSDELDEATWKSLTSADNAPVLKTYTITQQDAAGPFAPNVGEDFVKMSKVQSLGYTSPLQMLSQRFHMDEQFLQALNPGADLSKAGTPIVVVDPGQGALPEVKTLDVNKKMAQVIAYDDSHKVVAVFPATVGSTTRPSPKGTWKVTGVSQNPDYMYDPSKLTWGPKHAGKLHIPPGPNNPVGVVWIALSAPDYGIHGSPDPHVIGKTASHGCVRLTNWDAEELSKAVKPGVKVTFVSERG